MLPRLLALLPALAAALLLGDLALPAPAAAQSATEARTCPDPTRIRGLCSYVNNRSERDGEFLYRIKLNEGACIEDDDDFEERKRKVLALWAISDEQLVCPARRINILKIGVEKNFEHFINDVVNDYRVPLNRIDDSDGKTVLDFIQDLIDNTLDDEYRPVLGRYYELFRFRGALHQSELPPDSPEVRDYCRRAPGAAGC